ncbi:uncharacterized protein A1O5_08444 [Cladophialophora psammophila CBS 110553]|uniref:Uncharacterized protein n=1 Tax=Cladophialophora psammophila CBS 110553 TaxID=1182543 RepID=W9WUD0_9EURO|nr:uncharacterized protein A1O5_08444 [Cladophialophora psammophila CBS 110553]EXJ68650.1 hypothetical protein A1O5_08444 [Cladophialophora psammophila CBS 110553]
MSSVFTKRIVLRFSMDFEREEAALIERFFAVFGPIKPADDFCSHPMTPSESSKMCIVLDVHGKSFPTVDLLAIDCEVFKV